LEGLQGYHTAGHRPDLVAITGKGGFVPLEVELAQKSVERLKAIVYPDFRWRNVGKTGGVLYICGDEDGAKRIKNVAEATGYLAPHGGGLRVELLDDIRQQRSRLAKRNALHPGSAAPRRPQHREIVRPLSAASSVVWPPLRSGSTRWASTRWQSRSATLLRFEDAHLCW
jgi:hypothetical protein